MSNVIPNVENKILIATLEYGSKHGVANISTIEVAKLAKVSEYTIFKHFKTKKGLVVAAAKFCDEHITIWTEQAISESSNLEEFWDKCFVKLRMCPNAALYYYKYVLYYGYGEFERKKDSCINCSRKILKGEHTDEECLKFWDYLTTLMYLYYEKINSGYLSYDTLDMKLIKNIIFNGINHFIENKQ